MREPYLVSRRTAVAGIAAVAATGCSIPDARAETVNEASTGSGGTSTAAFLAFEMKVDWSTVIALQSLVSDQMSKGAHEIHLLISSLGGDVAAAIAGYNVLRAFPIELWTYNVGDVDSAASILFLAGAKRRCAPSSRFLFHEVRAEVRDAELSISEFKDRAASVVSDVERVKAIYMQDTKIDAATADTLISHQNWMDPQTALKLGVVQAVEPLRIPPAASITVMPVPGSD